MAGILLQHFRTSAGMLSFPGALPEARESNTLFRSTRVGSLSHSFNTGTLSMPFRASSATSSVWSTAQSSAAPSVPSAVHGPG